jgi:hypothetical protein
MEIQVDGANDTKVIPVPAGEFVAFIEEVKPRTWQSKDGSKSGVTLDVTWNVDSEEVKQLLGRDKVTVRQGIMLDMTEDGRGLAMGKGQNVGLGRLREATGLNTPGQPFAFGMLTGRPAKIVVTHRIDGENIYAEVKAVAKLG